MSKRLTHNILGHALALLFSAQAWCATTAFSDTYKG